jgi:hypothetical protein
LFFKRDDHGLRIFNINELIERSELKQEYDKCSLRESLFVRWEHAVISVDGRFIYTGSPYIGLNRTMISSTQPGKSWKIVEIEYTPVIPVTNGVFCMKVVRNIFNFNGGTPVLWNFDLTERLFKFPNLTGTFRALLVAEDLVACIMTSEVRFFDVAKKEIVACTQLPKPRGSMYLHSFGVVACGSQYHVVYKKAGNTLLLQDTNVVDLGERILNNLKPGMKYMHKACFSPSGGLLAFSSDIRNSVHILDILTYKVRGNISRYYHRVQRLEFYDEEHLLCQVPLRDSLLLINVKTCEILTSICVGVDFRPWSFSARRRTGDIVVFNPKEKTLKLFKLWLPQQRKDKNDLPENALLPRAEAATSQQYEIVQGNCSII